MDVHAAAVIAHQGFGHEGGGLAEGMSDVLDDILEDQHFIGLLDQGAELDSDLALTGGGDLMMVHFDYQAHVLQGVTHGGPQVLQGIDRRDRKITALGARPMADVAILVYLFGVPAGFLRIHLVERALHGKTPANIVKDEVFVFRAKQRGVGDAGGFHVGFGALGDGTRITLVALHVDRLDDVATQNHGGIIKERVHDGGAGVRHQDHVGFVDMFPARDGRAVKHFAFLKHIFVHGAGRDGDMLLLTLGVAETKIHIAGFVFLDHLEYFFRRHSSLLAG